MIDVFLNDDIIGSFRNLSYLLEWIDVRKIPTPVQVEERKTKSDPKRPKILASTGRYELTLKCRSVNENE